MEQRLGRIHRAPLLYSAARCGEQVLATWQPVPTQAELLTIDARFLASMGWGHWDLLSGKTTWSAGLSRILHADVRMPWTLEQLCDVLLRATAWTPWPGWRSSGTRWRGRRIRARPPARSRPA
ncbi:hypothetical protein ACFV0D_30395 [Streptomyces sp. NPDC059556]|uniref:hypothetical protein n=1 Tax=Streptomyces sp. NPDC059556 TaxID=3346863 RepID=UPI0036C4ABF5